MPGNGKQPLLPRPPAVVHRHAPALTHALARDAFGREMDPSPDGARQAPASGAPGSGADGSLAGSGSGSDGATPKKRETATDAIGRRAGALSDEIDFPAFVASLVHGTFDAIVDSAIRQMEEFSSLVAAVAKPVEQFTQENVSIPQVLDFLAEQYPKDLMQTHDDAGVHVVPRQTAAGGDSGEEAPSPAWLADYGLGGQPLTAELIDEQLVPAAREKVARNRLQTLSTMVLLGMNRVIVKDGSIGARLRFRAAAADHSRVDYAVGNDPNQSPDNQWGQRGSSTYDAPRTMVSTVGVNVQSDSELKAELFGDVKINFASETVPLDRFIDEARRNVLERHARRASASSAGTGATAPGQAPSDGVTQTTPLPSFNPPTASTATPTASATPAAAPGAGR